MKNEATTGPQIGAPPSLEQVPIGRLQVDPAYQRATEGAASQKIIAGMVKQWDWRLCQPLVVSRRFDGALFILDGQHRHAGATARGDIPFLPCVLLSSLDVEEEARTFVDLNTRRQKLSQMDIFHGMLAGGDADAARLARLLEETGWRTQRHVNTAAYKAGDLYCAPMLVLRLKKDGADAVRFALLALRQAWPDKAVRSGSTFLKALLELHGDAAWHGRALDMAARLRGASEEDWLLRADRRRRERKHLSRAQALAIAIQHPPEENRAARVMPTPHSPAIAAPAMPAGTVKSQLLPPPAPTRRVFAEQDSAPAFGLSGKGWCSQCETLRSRDQARACTSPFCKLKGAL